MRDMGQVGHSGLTLQQVMCCFAKVTKFLAKNHPEEKCNPPATYTILFENTEAKQDQLISNYKNMIKRQQALMSQRDQ